MADKKPKKLIWKLARTIYKDGGYNPRNLVKLQKELKKSTLVLDDVMEIVSKVLLLHLQKRERFKIIHKKNKTYKREPVRTYTPTERREINLRLSKYLEFPMMDGTRLKNATREHVINDAKVYRLNELGNARNARFLEMVAEHLEEGQKVGDVLQEDLLGDFMETAKNGETVR